MLTISCEKRRPPPFHGRRAVKDKENGYHVYSCLDLHLRYTGTLTIGKGVIWPSAELRRRELHSPRQTVLKLDFSRGRLREVSDVSDLLGALKSRDKENGMMDSEFKNQSDRMKTLTITITTDEGVTVYRASAERWTDFVKLVRASGPAPTDFDEELHEHMCWHSFRCRIYAEDAGFSLEEINEGAYRGGEAR